MKAHAKVRQAFVDSSEIAGPKAWPTSARIKSGLKNGEGNGPKATKSIAIDHAVTDETLYAADAADLRQAVEMAVRAKRSLAGADLAYATLRGARIAGVDLSDAVLVGADFSDVDLTGALLGRTKFFQANLSRAMLESASLVAASFANALLAEADLTGADLTGADLRFADLRGATMPDGRVWEDFRKDPLAGIRGAEDVRARILTAAFVATFQADLL